MSLICFDLDKISGASMSLECDIAKGFSGTHFGKLQIVLQVRGTGPYLTNFYSLVSPIIFELICLQHT